MVMNANKVIPENWLLSVNVEKITYIIQKSDQSHPGVWKAVIGRSSGLKICTGKKFISSHQLDKFTRLPLNWTCTKDNVDSLNNDLIFNLISFQKILT